MSDDDDSVVDDDEDDASGDDDDDAMSSNSDDEDDGDDDAETDFSEIDAGMFCKGYFFWCVLELNRWVFIVFHAANTPVQVRRMHLSRHIVRRASGEHGSHLSNLHGELDHCIVKK